MIFKILRSAKLQYITGNLFESKAEAIVNTVNTVGVMGKGIALQFKKAFPNNYKIYSAACKNKELNVGNLLVTEEISMFGGKKYIINFPTKTHWRKPSEYSYIESGLVKLVELINLNGSYITGYSSKDKKPFEELGLVPETEQEINKHLNKEENKQYRRIVNKTTEFLTGFYSSFSLELLSSVDYIMNQHKTDDISIIEKELINWNSRKKTMFSNKRYINLAIENINTSFP